MTKGKRVDVSSTWEISVHDKKRKMNYHTMYRKVSAKKITRTVNVKGELIVKGGKCTTEKMSLRPRTITFDWLWCDYGDVPKHQEVFLEADPVHPDNHPFFSEHLLCVHPTLT